MIGLDTNVLVRYLAQDEPQQAQAAARLVEGLSPETPGFVSTVALVETVWVMSRAYRMPRTAVADVVEGLLRAREMVVEDAELHYLALGVFRTTAVDYADAMIAQAGRRIGCVEIVTFDRRAAVGAGMRLLESAG